MYSIPPVETIVPKFQLYLIIPVQLMYTPISHCRIRPLIWVCSVCHLANILFDILSGSEFESNGILWGFRWVGEARNSYFRCVLTGKQTLVNRAAPCKKTSTSTEQRHAKNVPSEQMRIEMAQIRLRGCLQNYWKL